MRRFSGATRDAPRIRMHRITGQTHKVAGRLHTYEPVACVGAPEEGSVCVVSSATMNVDLSDTSRRLLADERAALSDLLVLLGKVEGSDAEVRDLRAALTDLEGGFMLVVCGEYNAGKSTLLNALLGMRVMPEGVTPTTDRVTVISWGEEITEVRSSEDTVERTAPVGVLKELSIVDTPGTNAIIEGHQELTERFIPRADMILFVTSADRPYTESEREFLELIASWGKKVSMVVNKADILESGEELERVLAFVREHAAETLGMVPPVLPVAARNALRAREAGNTAAVSEAGLDALEAHIRESLEEGERFRLKLLNPLGVGSRVLQTLDGELGNRQELLAGDRRTLAAIEQQREQFDRDIRRELKGQLSRFSTILLEVERRGDVFLNDTVQWRNVLGLMNSDRVRREYEEKVIRGADAEIDEAVSQLVDWFIERNLQMWEDVMEFVKSRTKAGDERIVGSVGGRFQYDRNALLSSLRTRIEKVMESYNRQEEAVRLADGLQSAVVSSGLLQVGGLGLGAAVLAFLSGAAADVTGITAGVAMIILGSTILPRKRNRAKKELHEQMQSLRDGLRESLNEQVLRELEATGEKLSATISPYTRFVRSELGRLDELRLQLDDLKRRLDDLRQRVNVL